uniref:Protein krueppel n=1 Tax=Mesocestoides corti TaxID=53468 RepID=A0A5K3EU14_MESCO
MDASNNLATQTKVDPDGYTLEEDVDLANITPMPKHVFLNTLPGHLAPFPTIPKSRYDTDRNQREFYGQESFLNAFITTHCRDYSNTLNTSGSVAMEQQQQQRQHQEEEVLREKAISDALKRNQCGLCLRVFANSASLKQHMRLHRGEKPYKCRFCDKTSATMCNILTHERTHTRERPYKCGVCGADFSSSSNLKTHMRTHSGDRPFRCNLCDRRFVTSNALTTHLRAHWGLRLHPCPDCDRQFSTSSNLRVHHRTVHLGIKQYQCSVCGKAFATSSNLNAHSRQHPESAYLVKYAGTFPHPANLSSAQETELEENGEEAVGLMASTGAAAASYAHTPTLVPVTVSPASTTGRKFAKVTVYCPADVEAAPASRSPSPLPHSQVMKLAPDE